MNNPIHPSAGMRRKNIALPAVAPPDAGDDARMIVDFAAFLSARRGALASLEGRSRAPFRNAMADAYSRFYRLAEALFPATPADIVHTLTQTVMLNLCRAAHTPESEPVAPFTPPDH